MDLFIGDGFISPLALNVLKSTVRLCIVVGKCVEVHDEDTDPAESE